MDPKTFTIPCTIGNIRIKKAMCDLGASIDVMHLSIYNSLNIGPIIQFADKSVVYLEEILEDVLVQINKLVFPVDFYMLNIEKNI